jgi:CDP-diacylglycerol--glycerol-3-phosphate 3-phosphatidyltransferase
VITIYQLKPAFQKILIPLVKQLAKQGITANQITTSPAILISIDGNSNCPLALSALATVADAFGTFYANCTECDRWDVSQRLQPENIVRYYLK